MVTEKKRHAPVRIFMRRLLIASMLVIVLLGIFEVWDVYQKDMESIELKNEALAQLATLSAQQNLLNQRIMELQTERGKEEALREQYGVGAPGEHEIVIEEPPHTQPMAATTSPLKQWLQHAFAWW